MANWFTTSAGQTALTGASQESGIPYNILYDMGMVESSGDPNAGPASGYPASQQSLYGSPQYLYQMTPTAFNESYNPSYPTYSDPTAQTYAGASYLSSRIASSPDGTMVEGLQGYGSLALAPGQSYTPAQQRLLADAQAYDAGNGQYPLDNSTTDNSTTNTATPAINAANSNTGSNMAGSTGTTTINPDGTTTTTYPDGSISTTNLDGSITTTAPNGNTTSNTIPMTTRAANAAQNMVNNAVSNAIGGTVWSNVTEILTRGGLILLGLVIIAGGIFYIREHGSVA